MPVPLHLRFQLGLLLTLAGSLATSRSLAQALTVTARTPAAHAVAAPRSGPVTTTFSDAISAATAGNVRVFGSLGQGRINTTSSGGGTSTLSSQPTRALTPGEVVSVTVPATVLGTNGAAVRPEVYQFRAAAGTGPADFAGGPTLPLTSAPNGLVAGDIDQDGDIDLIVPAGGSVGIRLNDGTGTFSAAPDLLPVNGNANLTFQQATLADVDNDGRPDLITSSVGGVAWLDVWRNTGGGAFAYQSRLASTSGMPVAADIDADGDLDLLVANPGGVVQVWLNAGAGTFSSAPAVPMGGGVAQLSLTDIDADGDLDILGVGFANGNYTSSYVNVRLNNGHGTFSGAPDLPANALARSLALGDLDGDGDADLVVGCLIRDTNLLLNNGDGTFTAAPDVPSSANTGTVTLADVDGDGDLDLLRLFGSANALDVSLNDGAAHFGPGRLVRVGDGPQDFAMADFDGDQALDIASAEYRTGSKLTLRFNRLPVPVISGLTPGSGPAGSSVVISGSGFTATTMVLFNGLGASFVVNGSGSLTATVPPGATTGPVTVITGGGTAVSTSSFVVTGAPAPVVLSRSPARNSQLGSGAGAVSLTFSQPIAAATAAGLRVWGNRSGRRLEPVGGGGTATLSLQPTTAFRPGEVVQVSVPASIQGSTGTPVRPETYQFTAAAGSGSGEFIGGGDVSALVAPGYMQPADLDADGDLDLIVSVATGIQLFTNDGQARFSPGRMLVSFTRTPITGFNANVADLDNDGDLDVFVGGGALYRNDGSTFTSLTIPGLLSSGPVKAGDLDGDGDLDLASNNSSTGEVLLVFNDGTGTFGPASRVGMGLGAASLALADVDGDGDLDLLTSNRLDNTVTLSRNNGRGSFAPAEVLTTAADMADLKLADMDGDGDLDVVVLSSYEVQGNTVVVLSNDGQGRFAGATRVQAFSNMHELHLADITGDGRPDLVLAGGGNIRIYRSTPAGGFVASNPLSLGISYASGMSVEDYNGDGALDLAYMVNGGGANSPALRLNMLPPPVVTSFTPRYGLPGTVVTLTGEGFTGVQSVTLNNLAVSNLVVNSPTSITFTVPVGATSGYINVNTSHGSASGPGVFDVTNIPPDLVVDQFMNVTGTYHNVTVLSFFGTVANLVGPLTVTGTLTVRAGGTLATNCQPITGPGNFVMQPGASITICDPAGISPSGPTGAIQLTGTRTFAEGYYTYNGTQAQVTGAALPSPTTTVTVNNAAGLTLSQPLALKELLRLTNGNLTTNGHGLTLLSTLVRQAYVDNAGGMVLGTATVQRRVILYRNAGLGYRHFSSPVANATVSSLTTSGFTPTVNPAYNTAPNPSRVQPFPTVFGYDAGRIGTVVNGYSAFDKGWVSPSSLNDPLVPGRGYTVNLDALQTVAFSGPLNNGPLTLPLTRPATPVAEGGWQLLGNPYPSPLDWSRVSLPAGLEPAIYLFQSSSAYGGTYRRYVNGIGNPVLDVAQGFFVRLADSATAVSLTLTNAARRLDVIPNEFYRTTPDRRPQLPLRLTDATGRTDEAIVYFEAGATAAFDMAFDARQLAANTGGEPSVWAVASSGEALGICGLPPVAGTTVRVPIGVALPQAGSFTLAIPAPLNATGLNVWLEDAVTGRATSVDGGAAYRFSAAAGTLTGRFALRIGPAAVLATTAALAENVALFPNPAHERLTIRVPAVAGAATCQVELLNALGQVVGQATGRLTSTGAEVVLPLAGQAAGLYLVRVRAGAAAVTKRLVVN